MQKKNFKIAALLIFSPIVLLAQSPPASEIYLLDLAKLTSPVNLTNRPGYDNQPMFVNDSTLLYTSIREDGQADIHQIDLSTRSQTRLTQTKESEYSPTVMPGGKSLSVVRVEADSTQRLWRFPFDGGEPALILENIKGVGYHAWGDSHTVALFIVGNPPTLHIADTRIGKSEMIVENVGRSLHKIPNRAAFSFVHKVSEREWWIKQIDFSGRKITPIIQALEGSEDYAWSPAGAIFTAPKAQLHGYNWGRDATWTAVADLSDAQIKQITRLAISPDGTRLAFVAAE
jgi:hypothetical protein